MMGYWVALIILGLIAFLLWRGVAIERRRQQLLAEGEEPRSDLAKIAFELKHSNEAPAPVVSFVSQLANNVFNDEKLSTLLLDAWHLTQGPESKKRSNEINRTIRKEFGEPWAEQVIEAVNAYIKLVLRCDPVHQRRLDHFLELSARREIAQMRRTLNSQDRDTIKAALKQKICELLLQGNTNSGACA